MELRIVVLVGVAAVTGWVARGVATGSAAAAAVAAPAPAAAPRVVYVAAPAREMPPDPLEEEELAEGEDLGELLARVQREAPPPPPPPLHNAITGIVTDDSATERYAGVTVVVSGEPIEGSRTAITDESGEFLVGELPAGRYRVTFYYVDATVEENDVIVSSLRHTTLNTRIATGSNAGTITVPQRTFESVLDGEGVSFTGITSVDNTYFVDGIELTGIE